MGLPERLVAGVATVLLVLGNLAAVGAADALEVRVSFDSKAAGASVVGAGAVHPLLEIGYSGGNDVLAIEELVFPAAYGAQKLGVQNVVNANIATPQSARGFADLGSGDFSASSQEAPVRLHIRVGPFGEPLFGSNARLG